MDQVQQGVWRNSYGNEVRTLRPKPCALSTLERYEPDREHHLGSPPSDRQHQKPDTRKQPTETAKITEKSLAIQRASTHGFGEYRFHQNRSKASFLSM
jgi:hypothetical protein